MIYTSCYKHPTLYATPTYILMSIFICSFTLSLCTATTLHRIFVLKLLQGTKYKITLNFLCKTNFTQHITWIWFNISLYLHIPNRKCIILTLYFLYYSSFHYTNQYNTIYIFQWEINRVCKYIKIPSLCKHIGSRHIFHCRVREEKTVCQRQTKPWGVP